MSMILLLVNFGHLGLNLKLVYWKKSLKDPKQKVAQNAATSFGYLNISKNHNELLNIAQFAESFFVRNLLIFVVS